MFGCIHIPDFPVQAALLREPKAIPVALLDGPESLLKVVACNSSARSAGIFTGMTKSQAEICGVTLIKRIQEHEDMAQAELIDAAYNFSPCIEVTSPGTIIIDLNGSERLLGTGKTIAQLILGEVTKRGLESNVSIAANPDTAHYAARGFKGITIIDPQEETKRLSTLPVETLGLESDVLHVLHAWGIRDFKSLAALPSIELTERLGQYGLHLQRLASGAVMRELVPAALPASFQESTELEEPIELLESLAFVLNRLLEQLMECLIDRSLATNHIEIELTLEVHSDRDVNAPVCCSALTTYQRTVKLPVPTQDGKVLLKLAQLDLAAHPPHAPVNKIKIEAIPARIRFTQAGLFQPLAPEPAKLEITMARIRAVVGEADSQNRNLVGFPALLDSYRPDHFQVVPPSVKQGNSAEPSTRLALRRFRPVIPARVEVNAEQAPVWIGFSRWKARVTCASGPWRGGGQWWDAAGEWLREEWDINLTLDGHTALYRIFRDLATRNWFVEGMYD
ncbi:MAG TPA: DNA polymerase Y family protein [Candidatus Angelobacter sp.]|nr:DNA polymerase Y family protein [Candidatus Angelobacter sp.]